MTEIPAWRLPTLLVMSLILAMTAPAMVGVGSGLLDSSARSPEEFGFRGGEVVWTTVAWSLGIGLLAVSIGMLPVAMLRGGSGRSWMRRIVVAAWLLPLLLPPALFFDAWWLELGPDSVLGRAAGEADLVPWLRRAVLAVGLLGTAVPLAVWLMLASRSRDDIEQEKLVMLDRPTVRHRLRVGWRRRFWPCLVAWMLTSAVVAGLTVPFDLAQVRSWGFELRTLDTRGASSGTLLEAGLPGLVVSVGAAVLLVGLLRGKREGGWQGGGRPSSAGGSVVGSPLVRTLGASIWIFLVGGPLAVLSVRAGSQDLEVAWSLHREALVGTLTLAVAGGVIGALVSVGFAMWRQADMQLHRGFAGRSPILIMSMLAVMAVMPATLLAVGVESIWSRPFFGALRDGPWPLVLAVSGRIAMAAAVVGWLMGGGLGALPGIDRPRRLWDGWRAGSPVFIGAGLLGALVGGTLAAGEIPVSARVRPPGMPTLTGTLLDAMHYQYADSVLPVVLGLVAAAGVAGVVLATVWSGPTHRRTLARLLICSLMVASGAFPGCERSESSEGPAPVPHVVAFGRPGNIDGRFDYPRAVAMDEPRERIYVVDKSARVQRFSLDGELETWWRMPAFENGKPTGLAVDRRGRVLVADTHEHRVSIFSPSGDLLEAHGGLGTEPGEFIYPTDIEEGPDGTWFVSEYGGNDRIQVFDADWNFLRSIGRPAEEDELIDGRVVPGLSRPQSLAWNERTGELFIADAIHHRIVVVDVDGDLIRTLGGPGLEPGRLGYPYDIGLEPDGRLLVVEYGNNRVQRLDPESGASLGIWGGTGREIGRLRYPWGLDVGSRHMVVLDSGNSRVLVGRRP